MEENSKQRRHVKQKAPVPLWKELLWLVPKNLVYILIFVVVASFAVMCWLVYTERNLAQFISSYDRSKEVVVVNPLFAQL